MDDMKPGMRRGAKRNQAGPTLRQQQAARRRMRERREARIRELLQYRAAFLVTRGRRALPETPAPVHDLGLDVRSSDDLRLEAIARAVGMSRATIAARWRAQRPWLLGAVTPPAPSGGGTGRAGYLLEMGCTLAEAARQTGLPVAAVRRVARAMRARGGGGMAL